MQWFFYEPRFITAISLLLRRTLVLKEQYSALCNRFTFIAQFFAADSLKVKKMLMQEVLIIAYGVYKILSIDIKKLFEISKGFCREDGN